MERIFRAEKMLARIERENLGDVLTDNTIEFIKMLDGKTGNDYNWESFVNDKPLVWIPADADQDGTYVALCDCD